MCMSNIANNNTPKTPRNILMVVSSMVKKSMPNSPLLLTSSMQSANSISMEAVKEVAIVIICTSNPFLNHLKGISLPKCIYNTLNTARGRQKMTAVVRIIGKVEGTETKEKRSTNLVAKGRDQDQEIEETRRTKRESEKDHHLHLRRTRNR